MFSQTELLKIISGEKTGLRASAIRCCLSCLTPCYRFAIALRNRKFDRAADQDNSSIIRHADIPVISVGNLTTGGTGKTPLVIWIAKFLRQQQQRVVLLSRGYGADPTEGKTGRNDEAIEMEHRLPDVPHLQDPNRFRMSAIAVEEFESQIIVLDDGFQHRQLHRDLDIVLIDATSPFGFGRLLPRGLLREPRRSLQRADLLILTRCDMIEPGERETIIATLNQYSGHRPIAQTRTIVSGLLPFQGETKPVEAIKDLPIFFFSGIGNPENFRRTLENLNLQLKGSLVFPDHHRYTRSDLDRIGSEAAKRGAAAILCTHKDLVKIGTNLIGQLPVLAVLIDIEFVSGQDEIETQIRQACNSDSASKTSDWSQPSEPWAERTL